MEMRESIARAAATAGGAVVFAGITVVIALVSLVFSGIPFVGNMGYSAAVAVLVAVTAAVTLLPALLGALGERIHSLRVQLGKTHPDDHQPHGWARWARGVVNRPWRSLVASVAFLLVLAIPVLDLELGASDNGELPKSTTARQAFDLMTEGFGPGSNGPLLIGVELRLAGQARPEPDQPGRPASRTSSTSRSPQQEQQLEATGVPEAQAQQQVQQQTASQSQQLAQQKQLAESPATDTRLTDLEDAIKKDPGIKSVSPATVDKKGTVAVFTAVADDAPSDPGHDRHRQPAARHGRAERDQGQGHDRLRRRPDGRLHRPRRPHRRQAAADDPDRRRRSASSCLMCAFRSLLVPLKAAVANLLSVGAAYGVVTFVFQEGHGAELIGLDGSVPIASYVPLLMFAILFGLSMDYEVFLMTQIQEHYKEEGDAHKAVVDGLANTGRVITSAALIMVCVFSSFVLNGNAIVKEFGVGLAVAIAIDATIVRCLAVPAIMALMGDAGVVAAEVARPHPAADQHRGRRLLRQAATPSSARPSPSPPSAAEAAGHAAARHARRRARRRWRGSRRGRSRRSSPPGRACRPTAARRPPRPPRARSPARASGTAPPRGRSPPRPRS